MARISIDSQILEAQRELQMRHGVYAERVRKGGMRQAEADLLIGRQEAIIATLRWVKANEGAIREWAAQRALTITERADA